MLIGCVKKASVITICDYCPQEIIHPDSLLIYISSSDLSEDFGLTSTKNDELIFIIYAYDDTTALSPPLILKAIQLNESKKEAFFKFPKKTLKQGRNYLLVLLEEDSGDSKQEIESKFRNNYSSLKKANYTLDFNTINKTIGDDDILSIKTFTYTEDLKLKLEGFQLLDRYQYFIYID